MRIRWTPAAAEDLPRISDYVKEHHPHYREATIRKVYAAVRSLNGGRTVAVLGVRKELES
jgi:plasmid stabilization system protein ParE